MLLASLGLLLATIGAGLIFARKLDQQYKDMQRKTYVLSFPSAMTIDQEVAWLRSISGTLRMADIKVTGIPTVAFELWATNSGLRHRLKVPWQHADYVIGQLRSLVPGIRVTPEDEWPARSWTRAVEVGLTNSGRQLRIPVPENMSASLLASVQALEENETVVMQWVVTPAIPKHPPIYRQRAQPRQAFMFNERDMNRDEVNDRRGKLEEPNMMAVLRIGAVANTPIRADHLIYRVKAALASSRTSAVRFHERLKTAKQLQGALDKCSAPLAFPMQLNAYELSALIAWPVGSPFVSGLPTALARQIPPPQAVPSEGRVIGRSNFPGNERKLALGYTEARQHVHVVGPTGVGKTALLANMMQQDIAAGYGAVLIENKGDLFYTMLNAIPHERLQDVIVLDINDKFPVGFNILEQGEPYVVIDELLALFRNLFKHNPSLWTNEVLYHGLHTLATVPGATFTDLRSLINPTAAELNWRDDIVRNLKDPELKAWWQDRENQARAKQDQKAEPLLSRIWELSRPKIRNILGQSQSSFHMKDVVEQNKILLVNLAGADDSASLLGMLLINSLWSAVKSTPSELPTFLYLDEVQRYTTWPVDAEDMLAQARSFGLGMVMAHQHLAQLPDDLRKAMSANARTKVVFQTTADDARAMTRDFGSSVTEDDFMNLGRYEAVARVATTEGVSQPLTLMTLEPARSLGSAGTVLAGSRQRYGRTLEAIDAEMAARRQPRERPNKRRPKLSGE